jgi:ribosomal protein L37AE/L43A
VNTHASTATARVRLTSETVGHADRQLIAAFVACGYHTDEQLVCPECAHPAGVSAGDNPRWACHECDAAGVSAIDFILTYNPATTFSQAVTHLLDYADTPPVPEPAVTVAWRIYDHIYAHGTAACAQKFFPDTDINILTELGVTVLQNTTRLQNELRTLFGARALRDAGILTRVDGRDGFIFANGFTLVEAHLSPTGHATGLQFRSPTQPEQVRVPQRLGNRHLVGYGLPRLHALDAGTQVRVVRTVDDYVAAREEGVEAYVVPVLGMFPPAHVCAVLARHSLTVPADAEDLAEYFRANKVRARVA